MIAIALFLAKHMRETIDADSICSRISAMSGADIDRLCELNEHVYATLGKSACFFDAISATEAVSRCARPGASHRFAATAVEIIMWFSRNVSRPPAAVSRVARPDARPDPPFRR